MPVIPLWIDPKDSLSQLDTLICINPAEGQHVACIHIAQHFDQVSSGYHRVVLSHNYYFFIT